MKKVVVFGGSGFLGSYVVQELLNRNYQVKVADLNYSEYFPKNIFIKCDILDKEKVNEIIPENTNYVFNFAGFANLDRAVDNPLMTINLNIIGNTNILEACKTKNVQRFVFASSAYAMSDKGSFYGISKLASEKIIAEYYKSYGLKYTIVRYGSVYSERPSDNNYIYNLIKKAITEKKIIHRGTGDEKREYIHAADVAKLSVDLIETTKFINEHVVLTGVEKMKRIELFNMIKEIMNSEVDIYIKKDGYKNHYETTPYSFHPTLSKKLVPNPFIDMGQGLLECIKSIHAENNENNE